MSEASVRSFWHPGLI